MGFIERILAEDGGRAAGAGEHICRRVHGDIEKYADARYDRVDVSNYFSGALADMQSHAGAEGFRRGAEYALRFVAEVFRQERTDFGRLDEEYARICGTIRERG